MDKFTSVFSTCFLILGSLIWVVAILIILVGAIGVLNVAVNEVFKVDLIKLYLDRKNKKLQEKEDGKTME